MGFTVIEIIIVAALGLLLMTALLRFLVAGYPLSKISFLTANSNETARVWLRRISREIRQARDSENGDYAIVEMLPQRLVFFADVNGDGVAERVRYELDGTNLARAILEPTGSPFVYDESNEEEHVVTSSIRNGSTDVFTYYNGDYPNDTTPLTPVDVTEVKYIDFYLLIDADPSVDPSATEVRSQVQIRNLKINLGEVESS